MISGKPQAGRVNRLVGVCNPDHNVHVFALKIKYPLQFGNDSFIKTMESLINQSLKPQKSGPKR
jgi:hypothetical protein